MADFGDITVYGALELLEKRECSSVELVTGVADLIKKGDEDLGAYISIDEEYALEQARMCDKLRASGEKKKLLGVPIAVKDVLNVRGQPCTCGSRMLQNYISPYDATVITRLREEGAVFLGRTNMDEFAMGSTTENSAYKITRNPHDRDCVAGGSSGGSAAAVASGEAIAALGSDTGGSIRQPAGFCGCVGLKPSYGRVSRYGLTAFASSLDQIGPITKNVRDTALLLEVISGRDSMDSTSVDVPVPCFSDLAGDDLKGVKLGLPR
ncbi:MAG: Asp-tRNA(Asn)/Glu-tRNA(Gln) amidotransferase subunit GatA, partial [Kiritimatiellae bacterium]|nr:Asp-tRNA(Asn)/Glu-tRNA(Gln) amidotransferase subunit GatA [Kiritimatiellia bacterium]